VIRDLNLEETADFKAKSGVLHGEPVVDSGSLDSSPARRRRALTVFHSNLSVKVRPGTRLLDVTYLAQDPKVSADVANRLVQSLVDFSFQQRFTATNDVSKWLERQLGDLRDESKRLQGRVVELQQSSGIFGVGGNDLQGRPITYSPVLERFQNSTNELSQAQISRVLKQSIYETVKSGDAELLSQLSGTAFAGAGGAGVQNSLTLLQELRGKESTLQSQISQDASQYGSAYPKLVEERASLAGLQQNIAQEIERIRERAKNDYEIAVRTEKGAQGVYDEDRKSAETLNNKGIEYSILSKEAAQSESLYQDLLRRLKEAGILEGLHSSNITVVDIARPSDRPSEPKRSVYALAGAVLAGLLGIISVFLIEAVDNKLHDTDELAAMNIPVFGIAPVVALRKDSPVEGIGEHSPFSEAIRSLRSTLLISKSGTPPQVIIITSSRASEGKSTISINLAASLSQFQKRVLFVEADLRRPVLERRFHMKTGYGLSNLLTQEETSPVETLTGFPNLFVIPAGPTPPQPAELLGSRRMMDLVDKWKTEYDFIVIDSPPLLPVTDTLSLQELADVSVLVVRAGVTTRIMLRRSYDLLAQHAKDASRPAIGVLLNFVSSSSAAYYGYYGYYGGGKYDNYSQKKD
jgi:succinoglycan biosynthesis transport protein ExoP